MNELLQNFLGDFFDTYLGFLSSWSERAFFKYGVPCIDKNPMTAEK